MASGSFNIDTFSYRRQLPLSNEYTPYSTATMFAIGPSSFLQGYSFYDYTTGVLGLPDASTMSVNFTRLVCTQISTVYANEENLYNFVSTQAIINTPFSYTFSNLSSASITKAAGENAYPEIVNGPQIDLSNAFPQLYSILNSFQYNLQVDVSYSIVLDKGDTTYNFVSTVAFFNDYNEYINAGRAMSTRINTNSNYTTVNNRFWFYAQDNNGAQLRDDPLNIANNPSTFQMKIVMLQNGGSNYNPGYNILIPGDYNYQFTFWPTPKNYCNAPMPLYAPAPIR